MRFADQNQNIIHLIELMDLEVETQDRKEPELTALMAF